MRAKDLQPGQRTSLEELLADPIVWTVMKADGVDEQELRNLLKRVAADLTAGSGQTWTLSRRQSCRRLSPWCWYHVAQSE